MRTISFVFTMFALAAGIVGCDSTGPAQTTGRDNQIAFEALEVGQRSTYIRFQSESFYQETIPEVTYIQDTLVVEITSATDSGFVFMESITPGSISLQNDSLHLLESASYHVSIAANVIWASSLADDPYFASNIFLLRRQPMPLDAIQENQLQLEGVVVGSEAQSLEEAGFVLLHEQRDTRYPHLNLIKDWSATAVDGPGYTIAYSATDGIVRAFATSPWTGVSFGWDLLE